MAIRSKTSRSHGNSLKCILVDFNRTLIGWFQYFQHNNYRGIFRDLDGWIRMSLRSLLRNRCGQRGRGTHIRDRQRWPNDCFAEQGLFSLVTAHLKACQSLRR
jgi:hypothetical protein